MPTQRFGISISTDHADALEPIEEECRDLDVNRSQIVDAILSAFFLSDRGHSREVRERLLTRDDPNSKTQFGVSIRESTYDELKPIIQDCESLDATRSDVVDAILGLFFENDRDHPAAVRKIVIKQRTGDF